MTAATSSDADAKRRFVEQQHRFRGLVSEYKSRRFVKDRTVSPERRFRSNFSKLLLETRAALHQDQYRPMLVWMAEMTAAQLGELERSPVGYDHLSGIHLRIPVVALEDELAWVAERLRIARKLIATFLAAKSDIEQATLAGEYEQAIERVDRVQRTFGTTLWSVQLRIALEHQAGGLERQKKYSAEVRAVFRRGLLGFTTYHTSVRNEDRTTFAKFLEDIEGRIKNHQYYTADTQTYARYRLKSEYPATTAELVEILRVEQSHDLIDIYETFVAVVQQIASRGPDEQLARFVVKCVATTEIDDARLIKVAHLLDPTIKASLPVRDRRVSNALLAGSATNAALESRQPRRSVDLADPWQLIYAGFAFAHGRRPRTLPIPQPAALRPMLARVLSRADATAEAWAQTAKLALNFAGLPSGAGILEFLHQIRRVVPDAPWQPWLIGLNSPTVGVEDHCWPGTSNADTSNKDTTSEVWDETLFHRDGGKSNAACLAAAAGCVRRRQFEQAIQILGSSDTTWPEPTRAIRASLLLHAHYSRGDRKRVIELIAGEGARGPAKRQFLPIVASLVDYVWADYKVIVRPLAAAIALHLLWRAQEDSLTASRMRFAAGEALRRLGVSRPSLLSEIAEGYTKEELIYFLRRVCIPEILDVSRLFHTTRELIEERQSVCRVLEDLDPRRGSEYRDEILSISNQLALDDGRWIVDSTRIHVDGDALVRWGVRELSEDYDRYRDLVSVSVEESPTFEDVLRELIENDAQRTDFSPENEADAVLLSLVKRMGEEFLTNATFGLDFYISKRVRHQSFIGLIRGPLELSGLITTRESEVGEYRRNEAWVDRFQRVDGDARDRIDAALRKFAARFDETLTHAKDAYFQLRSTERPQGMITLTLTDRLLVLSRAMVQQDLDIRDFLRFTIVALWAALEPSLANIRRIIADEIKAALIDEFDHVRASVRAVAEYDPAFFEFDAAMGRGSAEVQMKLDEAAQWFVHADTVASRRTFTLSQILKIGLDAAMKTQRGYSPIVRESAEGDLELQSANLVFVHDVLFVGLGNVQKHSGLRAPNIDVAARWNETTSTLSIEIVSDCRSSNRAEKARHADAIREAIVSGAHSRRRRIEGGSGFAKLAPVVEQSERGKLEFGFTPEGRFRLEVTYAVVNQTREPSLAV